MLVLLSLCSRNLETQRGEATSQAHRAGLDHFYCPTSSMAELKPWAAYRVHQGE